MATWNILPVINILMGMIIEDTWDPLPGAYRKVVNHKKKGIRATNCHTNKSVKSYMVIVV